MKFWLLGILAAVPALPQTQPTGGEPVHIHTARSNCTGAPEAIFGKVKGIYYACVKGQEVCSHDIGAISAALIADFEARMYGSAPANPAEPAQMRSMPFPTVLAAPITDERAKSIPLGSLRADVLEKLGEPYVRISGDAERFTYRLTSGKLARLDFENGKLVQIRIVAQ